MIDSEVVFDEDEEEEDDLRLFLAAIEVASADEAWASNSSNKSERADTVIIEKEQAKSQLKNWFSE